MRTVIVTEEHITLLSNAYTSWEDCEYGAPSINCKRPYGNSDVAFDIVELLKWITVDELKKIQDEGDGLSDELIDRAGAIHKELENVLEVVLRTKSFEPGIYCTDDYHTNWKKID